MFPIKIHKNDFMKEPVLSWKDKTQQNWFS